MRKAAPGVLVLLLAAPFVPPLFSVAWVLAVVLAWWSLHPAGRQKVAAVTLVVASLVSIGASWRDRAKSDGIPPARIQTAYELRWRQLDALATAAAAAVEVPAASVEQRREVSSALAEVLGKGDERTLLLVDPHREVVAWAGRGLLHDLRAAELDSQGFDFREGFSATSLLAVRPIADRGWLVVAGESLSTDTLPFADDSERRPRGWRLLAEADRAHGEVVEMAVAGLPTLLLQVDSPPSGSRSGIRIDRRLAGVLAAFFLVLVLMQGTSLILAQGSAVGPGADGLGVCGLGALVAGALSTGVPWPGVVALLAGFVVMVMGVATSRRRGKVGRPSNYKLAWPAGIVAAAVVIACAWAYQSWVGPQDLAASILSDAETLAIRLSFFGLCVGALVLLVPVPGSKSPPSSERNLGGGSVLHLGAGVLSLLLAGVWQQHSVVSGACLLGAGAFLGHWLHRSDRPLGWGSLAALCLTASLLAATAMELAYQASLRNWLRAEVIHLLGPLSSGEQEELAHDLRLHFDRMDVAALSMDASHPLGSGDLALALWRDSPLARAGAFSAISIETPDRLVSEFSYGLPLDTTGELDRSAVRWENLGLRVDEALIEGEVALLFAGQPWARLRYWLFPRADFRLTPAGVESLTVGLLRGRPASRRVGEGRFGPAVYARFDSRGQSTYSPWPGAPPLPPELDQGGPAWVLTPAGRAWAISKSSPAGFDVLFLPALRAGSALERVGSSTLSILLLLAAAALLMGFLALPRRTFRHALTRLSHSYSNRLIFIYTTLLLVPLLLLNLLLLREFARRLDREQTKTGQEALNSAQQVLGEYVLALDPGFGINTALNNELLVWLSEVVHHEINLYWGSELHASSKPELFTAGLLPIRVPAEVFTKLSLEGFDLASRSTVAEGVSYLEYYAPVRIPGVSGQERLILSIPLLAQQEELAAEFESLRRRAVLVTSGLFVLLIAAGFRLTRNFTRPIMQLVRGTQDIARGARGVGFRPRETEIASLADAIDDMAAKVHDARRNLIREKEVVERVVDNITSAVVLLDSDRRVLMHNRVAAELLKVSAGMSLWALAEHNPQLQPIAQIGAENDDEVHYGTLRLEETEESEEREWTLVWVPLSDGGVPASLLVVEDATEVLRGQRLQAWAEMARIIAHEIKNPLTPIQLSTEHLREVYAPNGGPVDEVFERCTTNILKQVEELRQIAGEFSTYSRIPHIELQRGNLADTVREVTESYVAASPPGVTVGTTIPDEPIYLHFDRKLLGRMLRNVLENALRASSDGGSILVVLTTHGDNAVLSVADEGPGVPAGDLSRIFDPYFSTHSSGTGLGLPIVRRIAEEHGGSVAARNRDGGGLEITVLVPLG